MKKGRKLDGRRDAVVNAFITPLRWEICMHDRITRARTKCVAVHALPAKSLRFQNDVFVRNQFINNA